MEFPGRVVLSDSGPDLQRSPDQGPGLRASDVPAAGRGRYGRSCRLGSSRFPNEGGPQHGASEPTRARLYDGGLGHRRVCGRRLRPQSGVCVQDRALEGRRRKGAALRARLGEPGCGALEGRSAQSGKAVPGTRALARTAKRRREIEPRRSVGGRRRLCGGHRPTQSRSRARPVAAGRACQPRPCAM